MSRLIGPEEHPDTDLPMCKATKIQPITIKVHRNGTKKSLKCSQKLLKYMEIQPKTTQIQPKTTEMLLTMILSMIINTHTYPYYPTPGSDGIWGLLGAVGHLGEGGRVAWLPG